MNRRDWLGGREREIPNFKIGYKYECIKDWHRGRHHTLVHKGEFIIIHKEYNINEFSFYVPPSKQAAIARRDEMLEHIELVPYK